MKYNDQKQKQYFSQNLRRLLKESGLTQAQAAEALDVNVTTFNNWCVGYACPKAAKLQSLASYFHVSVDNLMDSPAEAAKKDQLRKLDELLSENPELRKVADLIQGQTKKRIREIAKMIERECR